MRYITATKLNNYSKGVGEIASLYVNIVFCRPPHCGTDTSCYCSCCQPASNTTGPRYITILPPPPPFFIRIQLFPFVLSDQLHPTFSSPPFPAQEYPCLYGMISFFTCLFSLFQPDAFTVSFCRTSVI